MTTFTSEDREAVEKGLSEWISVKDRLPPNYAVVDVCTPTDGRVVGVKYDDGEWVSQYFRWSGNPTHWMFPPALPKEQA